MKYQAPRGTHDTLPKDSRKWQKIYTTFKSHFDFYNYREIITPIFEHTELFERSVGESTDIVNKEMYTFLDRSERSLTLRPEATAGVIRAYIENNLTRDPKPVKLWSYGPMFRYERAQTGRYRQFHQINAEILGSDSVSCEAESMFMLNNIFEELGVDFRIEVNSLGDEESRITYKEYFKKYTKGFLGDLCNDCKRRYEQNPLRMLDCKVREDQEIYAGAKKVFEFLSDSSQKRWEEIKTLLGLYQDKNTRKIKNIITNPNLVRGLDYYNDFVFEIKSTSSILKEQSAVCGGGRYDALVEKLGGSSTPGYGFAIGIERLILVIQEFPDLHTAVALITDQDEIYNLTSELYNEAKIQNTNLNIELIYKPGNISKQTEAAVKKGCDFIIFYLKDEKDKNIVKIKNTKSRHQSECKNNAKDIIQTIYSELIKIKK